MTGEASKISQGRSANGQSNEAFGEADPPSCERGAQAPSADIEGLVRHALSQHLIRSPYFPPTLARTLATDIAAGRSTAFTTGLNGGADPEGGRRNLDADPSLSMLWGKVKDSSAELRRHLIEGHGLPAALADELVMHGREGALTKLMAIGFPRSELEALAEELSKEKLLTPTLLLRSLCLGELMFFESALATLSATPADRVHGLIYDEGAPGFLELYELARLPLGLFRAFRATVEVIQQLRNDTARHWRSDFTNEIIARLVKEYEQVCPEDLEHVLSQLSRRLNESALSAEPGLHASA